MRRITGDSATPSLRYRLVTSLLLRYARGRTASVASQRRADAKTGPTVTGIDVSLETIAGVPVERYTPVGGATRPETLLFVHGGGFVSGRVGPRRRYPATLARSTGMQAISVDYRLAPEHPFPAGVEDVAAVYTDVAEHGRVVLAGDSAGGSLALGGAQRARLAGASAPVLAVLLWPSTDLTRGSRSIVDNAGKDYLSASGLEAMREAYLAGHDPRDPQASPLFAKLDWLPPTFIQVGDDDLIRDDGIRLAEALDEDGVDVTLSVWPHMIHAWAGIARGFPEAVKAVAEIATWIRTNLDERGSHPAGDAAMRGA